MKQRTSTRRKGIAGLLVAVLIGALYLPWSANGQGDEAVDRKHTVMAAFLYNFMSFVEWPETAPAEGPLLIGIVGADPFGPAIDAIERKTVRDRAIRFRHFRSVAEIEPTHLLFVANDQVERMEEILRKVGDQPVLICGEHEQFTQRGGMVRFYEVEAGEGEQERQLRIEINESLARRVNLQIRSKLLRLASVVDYPIPGAQ